MHITQINPHSNLQYITMIGEHLAPNRLPQSFLIEDITLASLIFRLQTKELQLIPKRLYKLNDTYRSTS